MDAEASKPWENLFKQISSPWDWVAIGVGAAAGSVVTAVTHGLDLGTSIATGATAGFTARKALVGSFSRRGLRKSAENFEAVLRNEGSPLMLKLADRVKNETRLWESKIVSDNEFSKQLERLVDEYRAFRDS